MSLIDPVVVVFTRPKTAEKAAAAPRAALTSSLPNSLQFRPSSVALTVTLCTATARSPGGLGRQAVLPACKVVVPFGQASHVLDVAFTKKPGELRRMSDVYVNVDERARAYHMLQLEEPACDTKPRVQGWQTEGKVELFCWML